MFLSLAVNVSHSHTITSVLIVCLLPMQNILEGLKQKNHVTGLLTSVGAVVQAVMREGDGTVAKSDPRKGGYAAGY